MIADPATPAPLRERLAWIHEVRAFASRLGLEVDEQYTSYVEWPGDRVVTTVVATPPGSLEPHRFWFPIVGRVPYKGFFDPARAEEEAEGLRADGFDVCVVPVRAYSTLGWFEDPITGPMLRGSDGALVETLLHELVHATVYLPSEADFNEGVASFIGEEGSVRFFAETRGADAAARERERVADNRSIADAVLAFRREVEYLYASGAADGPRSATRAAAETRARASIAALPLQTRNPAQVASQRAALGRLPGHRPHLLRRHRRLRGDARVARRRPARLRRAPAGGRRHRGPPCDAAREVKANSSGLPHQWVGRRLEAMTDALRKELFKLSAAKRLELLEELWDSIADEDEALALTDEQREDLEQRLAEADADPTGGSPVEEVLARIRTS